MENKLKNLPALGPTLDALKSQVEMQKVFIFLCVSNFGNVLKIIEVVDSLCTQLYLIAFLYLCKIFHLL